MPTRNPVCATIPAGKAVYAYNTMLLGVIRMLEQSRNTFCAEKRLSLVACRAAWNTFILQTEGQYNGAYPASIASAAWLGCLHARKQFHKVNS